MRAPLISIVVPTRNRRAAVSRLITALELAASSAPSFEVIIVDDGSSDDTVAVLSGLRLAFPFQVVQQDACGPAIARNAGAAVANGEMLLFLDDDVEPLPGTLAAHAALHQSGDRFIGLGDLPPAVRGDSFFSIILRGWWDGMRDGIQRPGYRYGFRDVLTGHCSIRREVFNALRGFDPALRCHEDWDLGYRALEAGLEMRFLPAAVAIHHESSDLAKALRRKFDEGVADVQLSRRHPALIPVLPLAAPARSRRMRLLRWAASRRQPLLDTVPLLLTRLLPVYEGVRLRFRWRRLLGALLAYWYWRGVASVLPQTELAPLQRHPAARAPQVTIDLQGGVDAAAREIDRLRPDSMQLVFGADRIGVVWPAPGRDRLRGEHLRPVLARWFPVPYQRALARAGVIPPVLARAAIAAYAEMLSAQSRASSDATVTSPSIGRLGEGKAGVNAG